MLPYRAAVCVLLLVGAALAAEPSVPGAVSEKARPITACDGAGPRMLEIVWVGLPEAPALHGAVCDWFDQEKWRVRFVSPSTSPRASRHSLRIVVTLPSTGRARLSVDVASGQHWVHEIELPDGLGDPGIEILAEALHSVAQAAGPAEGEPRTLPPSKPAPPELAPPTPRDAAPALADVVDVASTGRVRPPPSVAPGLHLPVHTGLGYLVFLRGDEPLLHGPALHLALDWAPGELTLGSFFRAALLTSDEKRLSGLQLSSTALSLGTGLALRAPVSALGLRAAFGGSVDLIALEVQVLDARAVRLAQDLRARPRFFLGAEAGADWRLGAFELELAALLRWQLSHTTYQVQDEDELLTVLEPWRLQPGLSLAAAYIW